MKFEAFCSEYGIPVLTEGDRHCRPGWMQLNCPFCSPKWGKDKWHLGFNLRYDCFNCWQCGRHTKAEVVSALLNVSMSKAAYLVYVEYGSSGQRFRREVQPKPINKTELPEGTGPMREQHRNYLLSRGFSPLKIESMWKAQGTSFFGKHSHRLVMPILVNGELVSWQTRDITGQARIPYLSCPAGQEQVKHKHIVYGMDLTQIDRVVIVEGVFDAWRMGPGAVATFGLGFTDEQVSLLSEFSTRFIVYDNEDQAQEQARKLGHALDLVNPGHTEVVRIEKVKDPGELSAEQAEGIMSELLNWRP